MFLPLREACTLYLPGAGSVYHTLYRPGVPSLARSSTLTPSTCVPSLLVMTTSNLSPPLDLVAPDFVFASIVNM